MHGVLGEADYGPTNATTDSCTAATTGYIANAGTNPHAGNDITDSATTVAIAPIIPRGIAIATPLPGIDVHLGIS
ncbi:MAG: hypothetical protein Q7R60_02920 [bacterium]|nr:hypothetical protein [bacterium]